MTDLGKHAYFMGMEILRTSKGLILHQTNYSTEILEKFNMMACNSATTPADINKRNELTSKEEIVDLTLFTKLIDHIDIYVKASQILAILLEW